jgi:hypothetical protein
MRRAAIALLIAIGLSIAPAATASAAPADDIYALVNQARWANAQAGLIRNAAMDQVAANWAATMAANGTMSHNPDYASQIPGGWSAAGENVAQGYPTGAAMHDGWMSSSGHRANILGDYTDVGIAFLNSGGTTWGVQVFARYPGHAGPTAPAPPAAPAPAPPSEPAPAEAAAAAPTPTIAPTASPTANATPSAATPEPAPSNQRDVISSSRPGGGGGPEWWGLAAGVVAVAIGAVSTALRRRRSGGHPDHRLKR